MRQQTFVMHDTEKKRYVLVLDMDVQDYRGRKRGGLRFYDPESTGPAPRGSLRQGPTVDGVPLLGMYAEEVLPDRPPTGWAFGELAYQLVRSWTRMVYDGHQEEIPQYIAPLGR